MAWGSCSGSQASLLALVLGVQGSVGVQRPAAPTWATIWSPPWGPRPPFWAGTPPPVLCGAGAVFCCLWWGRLLKRWGLCRGPGHHPGPWPSGAPSTPWPSIRQCFWPGRCSTASACAPMQGKSGPVAPGGAPAQYAGAVLTSAAVSTLGRAGFGWLFGVLYQRWGSGSIFWLLLGVAPDFRRPAVAGEKRFPQNNENRPSGTNRWPVFCSGVLGDICPGGSPPYPGPCGPGYGASNPALGRPDRGRSWRCWSGV